jgi:hypothetical protein
LIRHFAVSPFRRHIGYITDTIDADISHWLHWYYAIDIDDYFFQRGFRFHWCFHAIAIIIFIFIITSLILSFLQLLSFLFFSIRHDAITAADYHFLSRWLFYWWYWCPIIGHWLRYITLILLLLTLFHYMMRWYAIIH